MYSDYHVHTRFSPDSEVELASYINIAKSKNIQEICFTDHYDLFSPFEYWECNIDTAAYKKAYDEAKEKSPICLKWGAEMGLMPKEIQQKINAELSKWDFDYIIASVHFVQGMDPWFPSYFENRDLSKAFSLYIQTIFDGLQNAQAFSSVGHIDYPTKGCVSADNALKYSYAADELDALFKFLAQNGKCMEINTSVMQKINTYSHYLQILKRYRELGCEYVVLGSDSHNDQDLGRLFDDAKELALSAGIKYYATFDKMLPNIHAF